MKEPFGYQEIRNYVNIIADGSIRKRINFMKQYKTIVKKHPDGYVAYPLDLKGLVVGQGNTYE